MVTTDAAVIAEMRQIGVLVDAMAQARAVTTEAKASLSEAIKLVDGLDSGQASKETTLAGLAAVHTKLLRDFTKEGIYRC
jgi:hypothetical protein